MISPSSYIIATHAHKTTMDVWRWDKKEPVLRFPVKEMLSVAKLSCNTASFCVAATRTGRLSVWQVSTGQLLGDIDSAHYMEITDLDISSSSDLVITGGKDCKVKVWSLFKYDPPLYS